MIAVAIVACKKKQKPPTQHRGDAIAACTPGGSGAWDANTQGCHGDNECTAGKKGRCNRMGDPHRGYENVCVYDACAADADCESKALCQCDTFMGNRCVPANCRRDADCDDGLCSPSKGCRWDIGYYCHSSDDECVEWSDCERGKECVYSGQVGHWACVDLQCPVG